MAMKKKKKKTINWKEIEKDFRAGKISVRQIAEWHEVTEGAIRYRAKKGNWSALTRPIPTDTFVRLPMPPLGVVSELPAPRPTVSIVDVKVLARSGKDLAFRMLDELDASTSQVDELEDLIVSETAGDRDGRRRQGMLRAVDLPARSNTLKALALAIKTFSDAERTEGKPMSPQQHAADRAPTESGENADGWDGLLQ